MQRREQIALLIIIGIAAGLRMAWPGMTEFKADEARLMTLAFDMVEGHHFPLVGISNSAGLPNFPMSVWLYALPLFVWKHVYAATLFTGLLNTLAVVGCWWLTRRFWGSRAALVAALFFAVNPWAVMHARKIWAQNLLAPFVVGWAICLLLAIEERRTRWLIGSVVCLSIAVQAHLAAISLVPATGLVLLVYRRRVDWRPLAVGLALSIGTLIPFAWYVVRNAALGGSGGDGLLSAEFSLNALKHVWLLSTGNQIHAYAGPTAFEAYLAQIPNLSWVAYLWAGCMVFGLWRVLRRRNSADIILLIWLACATLFFVWEFVPVVLHYLLPTYPAQFMLAGVGVAWLLEQNKRWLSRLSWGAIGIGAGLQVWALVSLLLFLWRVDSPGGFGTPLAYQLQAVEQVKLLHESSGAFDVLLMADGAVPAVDSEPAVYDLLLRGVPHRFVDANTSAVFPAGSSVVLAVEPQRFATPQLVAALASDSAETKLRNPSLTLTSYLINRQPQPDVAFEPPYLLANWVNLLGYNQPIYDSVIGSLDWQIVWKVGAGGDVDYHFGNRLLAGDGAILGQVDAAAFAAHQWRENDVVVSRFFFDDLKEPADVVTMYTSMYSYPDITPVQFLDEAANPFSESAEIPLTLEK